MGLKRMSFLSNFVWKLMERFSAQAVSLIVSVILARLLEPSAYGTVSLVMIFITIINVFVSDGFGNALVQKQKVDQLDYSSVFYFSIVFSFILYLITYFTSPFAANFFNNESLTVLIRVLAIRIIISSINSVQQAYVAKNMLFKKFFYSTLAGSILSAIIGIYMAYKGYGVWALVAQYLASVGIDTFVLWFTVRWRPSALFSINRLKLLFNYGWKLLIQSLFVTIYGNMRSLLIGKFFSESDLAFYSRGSYFPNLIVVNVDSALSSILFPYMANEQNDIERIKSIARRATKTSSFFMSPLLIGFAVCADSFVYVILTEKWMPIIPYLRIICVGLILRAAQTSTLQAIKSVGKSDLVLRMDIPVRIFGLAIVILALRYGVLYIAFTEVIVAIVGLILYSNASKKAIGYTINEVITDFGINTLQAIFMGIAVFFAGQLFLIPTIKLIVQIIIGAIVYALIVVIFKNENYIYFRNTFKAGITKKTTN